MSAIVKCLMAGTAYAVQWLTEELCSTCGAVLNTGGLLKTINAQHFVYLIGAHGPTADGAVSLKIVSVNQLLAKR